MLLNKPLIKLDEIDTELFFQIKQETQCLTPGVWNEDTSRQDSFRCHQDTQAIPLIYGRNLREIVYTRLWKEKWKALLIPSLQNVLNEYYGEGEIIRMCLCKLLPYGKVLEHKDDTEEVLLYTHRIHLPIVTNENIDFIVESDVFNLKEGSLYEFSNQQFHQVKSRSSLDRIHLIFDYLEAEKLEYFRKKHAKSEPVSWPTSYRDHCTGKLIVGES